jgi:polyhydroxyalkanoate synthesis regulator phasin
MKDKLMDLFMFGMGTASLAKEVVEDFVDEMIQSGHACSESRAQMVKEFSEKASQKREEYEHRFNDLRQTLVRELKPAMQSDLKEISQTLKKMERRLAALEKKLTVKPKAAPKEKKARQKV